MAHILLVQRDVDMRKLLRLVLRLDYHVEEATDAEAALAALRECAEPVVAILGDWPSTFSEGILQACAEDPMLRRHAFLLVSENYEAFTSDFRDLLERLSVRVIPVPFELGQLQALVREAVARADAAASMDHRSERAQD